MSFIGVFPLKIPSRHVFKYSALSDHLCTKNSTSSSDIIKMTPTLPSLKDPDSVMRKYFSFPRFNSWTQDVSNFAGSFRFPHHTFKFHSEPRLAFKLLVMRHKETQETFPLSRLKQPPGVKHTPFCKMKLNHLTLTCFQNFPLCICFVKSAKEIKIAHVFPDWD